ncbi:MAG: dihydrofolate reductase, partial [Wenzhouxiangellaceae bacterium]
DGRMPWHLPADLKHFKSVTMGHPVVMGRRTFDSIGKPLPGRRNIVVSRALASVPDGCELAHSPEQALAMAGSGPVMVIGGGQLYAALMPRASRMELTWVDTAPDGDTVFPAWHRHDWQLGAMQVRPADEHNEFRLVFCSFRRAIHGPEAGE